MPRTVVVLVIVSLALWSGSRAIAMGTSSEHVESSSKDQGVDIPDWWDGNGWTFFLLLQLFPAQLTNLFPSLPWVSLSADSNFYRLKVCQRAAVTDCMPAGAPKAQTLR